MSTKKEMADEINNKLGTDIRWDKMLADDLEKFKQLLNNEQFVKRVVGQYANNVAGDKVQRQVESWQPGMLLNLGSQFLGPNAGDQLVDNDTEQQVPDLNDILEQM